MSPVRHHYRKDTATMDTTNRPQPNIPLVKYREPLMSAPIHSRHYWLGTLAATCCATLAAFGGPSFGPAAATSTMTLFFIINAREKRTYPFEDV
jgi:hypothetical protein